MVKRGEGWDAREGEGREGFGMGGVSLLLLVVRMMMMVVGRSTGERISVDVVGREGRLKRRRMRGEHPGMADRGKGPGIGIVPRLLLLLSHLIGISFR
jgi:hypothetical protein